MGAATAGRWGLLIGVLFLNRSISNALAVGCVRSELIGMACYGQGIDTSLNINMLNAGRR
jgi:uncharacterized membrane protein